MQQKQLVVEVVDQVIETKDLSVADEYKKLNEDCDRILDKIKTRKSKKKWGNMSEKDRVVSIADQINKRDLDAILEVNRKAIEIETEVASQNEDVITSLEVCKDQHKAMDERIEKIIQQNEELSKEMFKMQVFFITGLLALVAQIIQIFIRK